MTRFPNGLCHQCLSSVQWDSQTWMCFQPWFMPEEKVWIGFAPWHPCNSEHAEDTHLNPSQKETLYTVCCFGLLRFSFSPTALALLGRPNAIMWTWFHCPRTWQWIVLELFSLQDPIPQTMQNGKFTCLVLALAWVPCVFFLAIEDVLFVVFHFRKNPGRRDSSIFCHQKRRRKEEGLARPSQQVEDRNWFLDCWS